MTRAGKLAKIIMMAYNISNTSEIDVFVRYYGHVGLISCDVYKNSWVIQTEADYSKNIYFNIDNESGLDEIINELEELKRR